MFGLSSGLISFHGLDPLQLKISRNPSIRLTPDHFSMDILASVKFSASIIDGYGLRPDDDYPIEGAFPVCMIDTHNYGT